MKLRNPQFEGQTKTKLGNTEIRSFVEKVTNDKLAEWLEEHPTEGRTIGAEGAAGVAGAHGGASGARPHAPQVAARVGVDAGQARRLLVAQPRGSRALHRRGRQRRRQREEGAQPGVPGDPADPRQDPERRAVAHRQDVAQRRDPGVDLRGRHRARRGLRPREAPLPQDHHHDRRRRRRLAHPHAAAHVLLPPAARDRARRPRVHRAAAAVRRQDRQGRPHVPEGRSRVARRSRPSTRVARSRSAGSRASARWTGASSATRR